MVLKTLIYHAHTLRETIKKNQLLKDFTKTRQK